MRHITSGGIDLIKRFEGFSARPYLCPAGYLTIGYGHVIRERESFPEPLTQTDAAELLAEDVLASEVAVLRLVDVALHDGQFDALVSFAFNLGAGALQRSTLRRKLNRGEYEAAASEFPRWVYANGKKLSGLVRRRVAEKELFIKPMHRGVSQSRGK